MFRKIIYLVIFFFVLQIAGLYSANNVNQRLLSAVEYGNYRMTKTLLDKGANPNTRYKNHDTVLIKAIKSNNYKIVKVLLFNGADANSISRRYRWNYTALLWATRYGRIKLVKLLLKHKAKIYYKGKNAALALAAFRGYFNIVKLLVNKGARVNIPDKDGVSILIKAAQGGFCHINRPPKKGCNNALLRYLLKKGAKVNLTDGYGRTALMYAAKNACVSNVKLLLSKGADLFKRSKKGETALSMAIANHREERNMRVYLKQVIKYLKKAGRG